jgi:hypothetical protein
MRMSLDNRRRYLEKIFHFPCGDEPVAGALMQVILEKDSRASLRNLPETCLRTRGTHALHHLASLSLQYHLKDPEERLNPILTETSLASSPRIIISPSLPTQFQRTNELTQRIPKAGRSAALTALHRLIKQSYAFIDSIRFSFPSPAPQIRGLGKASDIKAYQDQSDRGDASRSKLLLRSYLEIQYPSFVLSASHLVSPADYYSILRT